MSGITRLVDSLGRITIPSDMRAPANIGPGSLIEVDISEDKSIIIKPHSATCHICHGVISPNNFGIYIHEKKICKTCFQNIKEEDK